MRIRIHIPSHSCLNCTEQDLLFCTQSLGWRLSGFEYLKLVPVVVLVQFVGVRVIFLYSNFAIMACIGIGTYFRIFLNLVCSHSLTGAGADKSLQVLRSKRAAPDRLSFNWIKLKKNLLLNFTQPICLSSYLRPNWFLK